SCVVDPTGLRDRAGERVVDRDIRAAAVKEPVDAAAAVTITADNLPRAVDAVGISVELNGQRIVEGGVVVHGHGWALSGVSRAVSLGRPAPTDTPIIKKANS